MKKGCQCCDEEELVKVNLESPRSPSPGYACTIPCNEKQIASSKRNYAKESFPFKQEDENVAFTKVSNVQSIVTPDGSESTLSVVNINNDSPLIIPRKHGPGCAIEVSILEKHDDHCKKKHKIESDNRNLIDDKVGSYDVIGRYVYNTCNSNFYSAQGDALRGSPKGFSLNDPDSFGKSLMVNRSKIEALPILPPLGCNQPSFIMRTEVQKTTEPICTDIECPMNTRRIVLPTAPQASKVMSVYVRTDKNEPVPSGFTKLHFPGDACKLRDPNERSRQILALQKVMKDTKPASDIAQSPKKFGRSEATQVPSIIKNSLVMTATTQPLVLPKPSPALERKSIVSIASVDLLKNIQEEPEKVTKDKSRSETQPSSQLSSGSVETNLSNEQIFYEDGIKGESSRKQNKGTFGKMFGWFRKKPKESDLKDNHFNGERRSLGTGKRVTHSQDWPRRHDGSDKPRKLSAQYKKK